MAAAADYTWTVPADHPAFAGHFPGRAIVPGVVLLDQALLFAENWLARPVDRWQVANAKFLSPVGPGEVLTFALTTTAKGGIAFTIRGSDREVASGSLNPLPA